MTDILTRPAPGPDEELRYGDHPDQVIDLWTGTDSAVVLVHGGFWRPAYDRIHLRPMANALRPHTVAAIEYRREPGRPDRTLDDVTAALAMLAAYDGVLVGHSAGGHLALWAAATRPVRGVLALAPVSDLGLAAELDLDDGAVRDFAGRHDPAGFDPVRLPAPHDPVTIVHGTADRHVPLTLSESYATAHPECTLLPIDGADHFALIDPVSAAWTEVVAALEGLERPR